MQNIDEQELIIEQIPVGPMQNFTYIVGSRATREVAIVDPAWEIDGLVKHINDRGYTLTGALVTHYHPDHIGGSPAGWQGLLACRMLRIEASARVGHDAVEV